MWPPPVFFSDVSRRYWIECGYVVHWISSSQFLTLKKLQSSKSKEGDNFKWNQNCYFSEIWCRSPGQHFSLEKDWALCDISTYQSIYVRCCGWMLNPKLQQIDLVDYLNYNLHLPNLKKMTSTVNSIDSDLESKEYPETLLMMPSCEAGSL